MILKLKHSQTQKKLSNDDIHLMPCRIHAEGQYKITEYFKPYIDNEKSDEMKASFRGRSLQGKVVHLPENYIGVVAQAGKSPDTETKNLFVTSTFASMTFWNWDKPPSKNDPFLKAMDWIEIAEALHAPVVDVPKE
ncbi:hypothetical protein J437_LFUL005089 [Ladona fulva]|uniref:Uncharacterized protein n=1 Tax=Ladona fulva TaxID=123851 RepID=A0A8K0NYB0_LADFU|nr:hypothetical protein J437_LFUL005089 [Ladona fulva]